MTEGSFFEAAFETSAAPSLICSLDGKVLHINRRFSELCGRLPEQLHGADIQQAGIWVDQEQFARAFRNTFAPGHSVDVDLQVNRGDSIRNVITSARRLPGGEPCILLTAFDVTDRLNEEVKVRQAQKMEAVGQLASGFAHGFNNILAVVQGYTGLVLTEPDVSPSTARALKEVASAAERGANLTRQLLVLSRKQVMQPVVSDLNALLTGAETMLRHVLGAKIRLAVHPAPCPLWVNADTRMIEQVLVNVTANARDAMPNGGEFTLRVSERYLDRCAVLELRDTGCGMSPTTLNRIFEPFFTTKDIGKGVGLGLSTVYAIIKQHKGAIDVTSEVGAGTSFEIALPLHEKAPIAAPTPASDCRGKERILLVEDEDPLRQMVESILLQQGYELVTAVSGRDAVDRWRENEGRFDLLLTDIAMPEGITGRQLATQLRQEKPGLRVIYTTGYSVDLISEDNTKWIAGMNFLQKPYQPRALIEIVRKCLDQAGPAKAA